MGLAAAPLSRTGVSSVSELAGFALALPRPPAPVGLGGLVPHTERAVLDGLPFTSSSLRDFRTHTQATYED